MAERDDLEREITRLRDWRHERVDPTLRALELRDQHKDALLERLDGQLAAVRGDVAAIAKRDEIEAAVTSAVESATAATNRHWSERLALPYRALLYAAAASGALVVIVNAARNLLFH